MENFEKNNRPQHAIIGQPFDRCCNDAMFQEKNINRTKACEESLDADRTHKRWHNHREQQQTRQQSLAPKLIPCTNDSQGKT